jgi:hypothetical protein
MAFSWRFWGKPPIPSVRTAGLCFESAEPVLSGIWSANGIHVPASFGIMRWVACIWNRRKVRTSALILRMLCKQHATFDLQQAAWPYTFQDDGFKWPPRDLTRPWTFIRRSNKNSLLGREIFKRPSFCTLALKMWAVVRSVGKNRLCLPIAFNKLIYFCGIWR